MYKNLVLYLGLNAIVLLLGFGMLPLISNVITPIEYGKVGLFFALVAFIQPMIGVSTESLVQVKKHSLPPGEFEHFLTNIYIVSISGFLLIEIALQIYYFFESSTPRIVLFILPMICLSRFFINLRLMEYTIDGSPVKFGLSRIAVKLWSFFALLYFYLVDYSVQSLPYICILLLAELVVVVVLLRSRFVLFFKLKDVSRKYIIELLSFGIPIALATIPLWVVNEYGKVLLKDSSLEAVGLFTLAKQLSLVYVLVCASVSNALVSSILGIKTMKSLVKYFLISIFVYILLLIVYLCTYEVLSSFVIGEKYDGVSLIFKVLLVGCVAQVTTAIPSNLIAREGRSKILLISAVVGGICFMFSNYFIFTTLTTLNIAFSYVIGMAAYAVSMWLYTLRLIKNNANN